MCADSRRGLSGVWRDCLGSPWAAGRYSLLLLWVLHLKLYGSGLKTCSLSTSGDVLFNGFQGNREKSIPGSRSLLIGRVGGSYLIKQVPQHRSPGPWEEGQGALDEALEKPTQWPKGARKLHLNESSVHWLRTVTAAKWGCCQEVGPRKLSSCLELHFLTVWTQWANRLGVSVCRRRGLEWG